MRSPQQLDDELAGAYRLALSGKTVGVSPEAYTRLYRMAYFHIPLPRFVKTIRAHFS